jgi:DNA-binding response OmpR family regulator
MINLAYRALRSRARGRTGRLFHLDLAATGEEAIRKVRETRPDAVLLDLTLPDISGLEVLKEIQPYNIPVIFITAHEWPQVFPEQDYESLRIHMRRPLNRNELSPALKSLLEVIRPRYPADLNALARPAAPAD